MYPVYDYITHLTITLLATAKGCSAEDFTRPTAVSDGLPTRTEGQCGTTKDSG
jgi:hypothetical protein